MRVHAMQVWPPFRYADWKPAATASSTGESSRTTNGDLPPSSRAIFFTCPEASSMIRLPARVEPVNEIMLTSGLVTSASPTTGPVPVTRLKTPRGSSISSRISARTNAVSGATSLGFRTIVHPAASAGATFATTWCSG